MAVFACVCRPVDHYSFASVFLGWSFNLALAYPLYRRSTIIHCSFVGMVRFWFPYASANGRMSVLVEAAVLPQKREASGVLGQEEVFHA